MSLKDALLKAGFSSTKIQNERKPKLTKEVTKVEKHQAKRNYCEVCDTTQPDVERFKHRNARVDAEWICVNCADKNEIHDKFRLTAQSDFALQGRYQRFWGPTEKVGGKEWNAKAPKPQYQKGSEDKKPQKSVAPNLDLDEDDDSRFNR
jgi:ribosomal protein L37AE/L43A